VVSIVCVMRGREGGEEWVEQYLIIIDGGVVSIVCSEYSVW
jgi:hypothetical protein